MIESNFVSGGIGSIDNAFGTVLLFLFPGILKMNCKAKHRKEESVLGGKFEHVILKLSF